MVPSSFLLARGLLQLGRAFEGAESGLAPGKCNSGATELQWGRADESAERWPEGADGVPGVLDASMGARREGRHHHHRRRLCGASMGSRR